MVSAGSHARADWREGMERDARKKAMKASRALLKKSKKRLEPEEPKWSTADELATIHVAVSKRTPKERVKWLQGYLEAARRRRCWGHMEGAIILLKVEHLIGQHTRLLLDAEYNTYSRMRLRQAVTDTERDPRAQDRASLDAADREALRRT